ncbi:HNH endonuclease [Embleya sp. NPDC059237]|uniref:HNH endonuclease n=1 Tax=Embleya sp. NPDC059237 TaxID=3346784 RepID=UPI003684444F
MATETVSYGGGDNSVLRLVLYRLWRHRCYWCDTPKEFNDIEIDHIIPQSVGAKELKVLGAEYCLPSDFDIDGAENLAPICSAHNGPRGKGNKLYKSGGVMLGYLDTARRLKPTVVKRVKRFGASGKVAEYLLNASETDLNDPAARQAFEEYAPAIVQKLALLDEEKADFSSFQSTVIALDGELSIEAVTSLSSRGRTAAAILLDVCGSKVEDVLVDRVAMLVGMICRNVEEDFAGIEAPLGPTNSGPPVMTWMRVEVDSIDYEREGRSIEFTFSGKFEADLTASLVQDNRHGGLDEIQGDGVVQGTFSFDVAWMWSSDPGDVDMGTCRINSWEPNLYTEKSGR